MSHHSDQWSLIMESKPKIHYYMKIKTDYVSETYCNVKATRSQRSLIVKFRLEMFPVNVELGRYKRMPREQRIMRLVLLYWVLL